MFLSRAIQVLCTSIKIDSYKGYQALVRLRFDTANHTNIFSRTEKLLLNCVLSESGGSPPDRHILSSFTLSFAGVPFPSLRHLELTDACMMPNTNTNLPTDIFRRLSKTFTTVRILTLDLMHFRTFRDFVRLVCALPQLRELILVDISFPTSGLTPSDFVEITPATGSKLELNALTVVINDLLVTGSGLAFRTGALFGWLVRTQCVSKGILRRLKVESSEIDEPRYSLPVSTAGQRPGAVDLNGLLQSLGPALQHLDVNSVLPSGASYFTEVGVPLTRYTLRVHCVSEPLLLHHCTGLEELILSFPVGLYDILEPFRGEPEGPGSKTLAALAHRVPSLHKLVVKLTVVEDLRYNADRWPIDIAALELSINWESFNSLIADTRFSGLRDVELHVSFTVDNRGPIVPKVVKALRDIQSRITEQLERLSWHEQGIMTVRRTIIW